MWKIAVKHNWDVTITSVFQRFIEQTYLDTFSVLWSAIALNQGICDFCVCMHESEHFTHHGSWERRFITTQLFCSSVWYVSSTIDCEVLIELHINDVTRLLMTHMQWWWWDSLVSFTWRSWKLNWSNAVKHLQDII